MTTPLALVSTRTAITYVFEAPAGTRGWASCTVNDTTGELLITSAWGDWVHRWDPRPSCLGAPSLTAFIGTRSNVDYLARKLQREGRNGRRWSATATATALQRQLSRRRLGDGREQLERPRQHEEGAEGSWLYDAAGLPEFSHRYVHAPRWNDPDHQERLPYLTRGTARRLWNAIQRLTDHTSPDLFYDRLLQIDGFTDYVTEEPWEYGTTEQTVEDRVLREIVLPALIKACRPDRAEQGRYIYTYDRGSVFMHDDEYLRTVHRFLGTLILVAENNGLADDPVVTRAKVESTDLLTLQRALCALIHLAKTHGLNNNPTVNAAKELIRCRVLGCGLAGACDGVGSSQYPCPLKEDR